MSLAAIKQMRRSVELSEARLAARRMKLREAVRDARKQHSVVELADALGMTRQGVYDLLNGKGKR